MVDNAMPINMITQFSQSSRSQAYSLADLDFRIRPSGAPPKERFSVSAQVAHRLMKGHRRAAPPGHEIFPEETGIEIKMSEGGALAIVTFWVDAPCSPPAEQQSSHQKKLLTRSLSHPQSVV
jgi:hypothetical protein